MKKALNTTKERRNEVLKMLCRGYTSKTIIERIAKKYDIGVKSIENDITLSYKEVRNNYNVETDNIIKEHLAKYDQIIEDCNDYYDPANKIKALQAKEKLLKLHSPDVALQVNNNTMHVDLNDLSVEELKSLLQE